MPIDFDTTENGELHPDEFGGFAFVGGNDNIKQQIENAIARALRDIQTVPLDSDTKTNIRRNIRNSLSQLSYVDEIVATSIYKQEETLYIKIQTKSEDFTIGL